MDRASYELQGNPTHERVYEGIAIERHVAVFALALLGSTAACAAGLTTLGPLPSGGIHVLFIGNSLTYVNDLPGTVAGLGESAGDTIRVRSVANPNFALIDHVAGGSNAVQVIRGEKWNFVVLQQGPTPQLLYRDTLLLATRLLDPDIRAAGARSATYMVWPASTDLGDFDGVLETCRLAAQAVGGLLLPAGEAWRAAWAVDPELPLYGSDGFHPSPLGTYLAALVIYEEVTGHDARSLPVRAVVAGQPLGTPEATVRLLQRVAHETVVRFAGR